MAIVFHCEFCGKKIEAPDSAGGKWGKCPACHNKLYVPSPVIEDELRLAPLDTDAIEREKQLRAETQRLTQDILQEKEIPDGPRSPSGVVYEMSDKELRNNVILYLRHIAQGDLNEAEEIAALIAPCRARAIKIIDRIALSEIPEPELSDIPPQVLASSIRSLRNQLR